MGLFKLQRLEDLDHFPSDSDLLVAGHVLDELLRDGRAARISLSEEDIDTGAHRRDPVHAVMVEEALVLDGHAGVDQVLRQLFIADPCAVLAAVELLQNDVLARIRILIINHRRLIQREIRNGKVHLRRQVVFHIQRKQTRKHQRRQQRYEQQRTEHLQDRRDDAPDAVRSWLRGIFFFSGHVRPSALVSRRKPPAPGC